MKTATVEDQLAIRQLVETFSIGCMRADSDIWGGTWAEECSWKIDKLDQPAVGKSNVIGVFEGIMANIAFVSINAFPADVVIEGDRGHGKAYSQELIFPKAGGGQRMLCGCSHDEYVKRDGRWYFSSRVFETLLRHSSE